jgi:putative ABC transport system ATP-binding protein
MTPSGPVLSATALTRVFSTRAGQVTACRGVDLEVFAGELVVIRGPSGSGKTTLLNLLGGLDRPTAGSVRIDGRDLGGMGEPELTELRRHRLGQVFQSFALLPMLSAAENVEIPLRIGRMAPRLREVRVRQVLTQVGLAEQADQRPFELSGGQQQRVGVARALVAQPGILLADEPTGQLDSGTASAIMDLIGELVTEQGIAAVITTHHPPLMQRASRLLDIRNGRVTAGG